MAVAAVPEYLGKSFETASPGDRFYTYLPIWMNRSAQENVIARKSSAKSREAESLSRDLQARGMDAVVSEWVDRKRLAAVWAKNDSADAQRDAFRNALHLNKDDQTRNAAVSKRAEALSSCDMLVLPAVSVAPFATGLGIEHPLENGFAFLNPYGLPYLPGSSIKGVLRKSAQELASGDWGGTAGWTADSISALFGVERNDETQLQRGSLSFWDVIPDIKGDKLQVEIMTPHQTHYYQNGDTPHDSGSPNPITFLAVPVGSGFSFKVQCNRPFLARIAPELAEDERWRILIKAAFEHAYQWLGFGAKTAVGYGAMKPDMEAENRRIALEKQARIEAEARRLEALESERLATMTPAQREMVALEKLLLEPQWQRPRSISQPHDAPYAKLDTLRKAAQADDGGWSASECRQLAAIIGTIAAGNPPRLSDNTKLGKDARKIINQLNARKD